MIPIRDNQATRYLPLVTFTLIGLNIITFLWDRQLHVFAPGFVFGDLAMRPQDVARALQPNGDQFALVTMFTSLFLHANLIHVIGNMLFLLTFGPGVEEAIGARRFAFYYIVWGVVAGATHVFVGPDSMIPTVGASGAIGGVLGAYFLLFPSNRIQILIPFVFIPIEASAWIFLGAWFLWQIFVPQQGVANWAHAGGFMAGMATVLIMGGRSKVIGNRTLDAEYE